MEVTHANYSSIWLARRLRIWFATTNVCALDYITQELVKYECTVAVLIVSTTSGNPIQKRKHLCHCGIKTWQQFYRLASPRHPQPTGVVRREQTPPRDVGIFQLHASIMDVMVASSLQGGKRVLLIKY